MEFARPSIIKVVSRCLSNCEAMIGLVPLLLAVWFWLIHCEDTIFWKAKVDTSSALSALLAMAVIWQVFFWSHLYIHIWQAVLLLPAVALGAGALGEHLSTALSKCRPVPALRILAIGFALPCWVVIPAVLGLRAAGNSDASRVTSALLTPAQINRLGFDQEVCAGMELEELVPPQGIIVTDMRSAVPLYYSRRHMIRGVDGDSSLVAIRPEIRRQLSDDPVYLALSPEAASSFPRALSSAPSVYRSACVIAARLN